VGSLQLFSFLMRSWIHPADVFITLYASDENAFWLDREHHQTERFTVMGHAYKNQLLSTGQAYQQLENRDHWGKLSQVQLPFAFRPGFIGSFDYVAEPTEIPVGTWLEAREALVFDHDNKQIFLIGHFETAEQFAEWVRAALIRLSISGGQSLGYRQRNAAKSSAVPTNLRHQANQYLDLIRRSQEHIQAGDVYQICLTNQIELTHDHDPLETFLRLRESNPAPYSTYLKTSEFSLVSSSPEQFLSLDTSGKLSTRPIKGTRPRSSDPGSDAQIAQELAADHKERAENLMIVDLMRNDLARVSVPDSISVPKLFQVEQYATVHQLVSTVESKILNGVGAEQAIASAFPGGSMTGAPKIRAMQIIDDLEGAPRGQYSGALGYLGNDGSFDLAMVIRTLVFRGDLVTIGVGGGITSDSDPEAELEETKLKARALLAVLNAPDPWAVAW
jgi:para-aminobenzoate synthetase component 1